MEEVAINFHPKKLRTVLQALRNLYTADCNLYFSVQNGLFLFESAGGLHRFQISFEVQEGVEIGLQKTTVGTFTQYLQMLNEYTDLATTGGILRSNKSVNTIRINKNYKENDDNSLDDVSLTKVLSVSMISDMEKEDLKKK